MNASARQVGGSHYVSDFQHWDYCVIVNVPNLEYAASKYVLRWRKKNGFVDLEKAKHYIEKRLESFHSYIGVLKGANKKTELFNRMCLANDSTPEEVIIMDAIMHWKRPDQLIETLAMIDRYIHQEKRKEKAKKETEGEATRAYVDQDQQRPT